MTEQNKQSEYISILEQGVEKWNEWRKKYPKEKPDLSGIDLSNKSFSAANFSNVNFFRTNLSGSHLVCAKLSEANLERAKLVKSDLRYATFDEANLYQADCSNTNFSNASFDSANLKQAILSGTNLCNVNLINADLLKADLSGADLREANLTAASLVKAKVCAANFENCKVYGISVWDLVGEPKSQLNLSIIHPNKTIITVDNLEVAQILHQFIENSKIAKVIDSATEKIVLILGCFADKRLDILDKIRDELRNYDYLPVLFDFDRPSNRNLMETVSTVAHLSRFIIADITDAKAISGELNHVVKLLKIPVVPIFKPELDEKTGKVTNEWGMFWDLKEERHVLSIYDYFDLDTLLVNFKEGILVPAEEKIKEISENRQKTEEEKQRIRKQREQNILRYLKKLKS